MRGGILRFLLPAYPPLLVLTAASVVGLLSRVPALWRAVGLAAVAMLSIWFVREAIDRQAFELRDFKRRFRGAGSYARRTSRPMQPS